FVDPGGEGFTVAGNRVPGLVETVVTLAVTVGVGRMCAAWHVAYSAQGPSRQDTGIHRCLQVVDDFFDGDDAAFGRQCRFFLHAEDAPEQDVAFTVGFLGMDHRDVRA